ncbi:MAG: hypothetical protein J6B71_03385 [Clostridia bacterium]|nr:hypothetical protein [Clostridia bacterium]
MKKILCMLLVALMLLSALSACTPDGTEENTTQGSTEAPTEGVTGEETIPNDQDRALTLAANGASQYTVIISAEVDDASRGVINNFITGFENKTQVKLTLKTDAEVATAGQHEIIVGNTARAESAALRASAPYAGYAMRLVDDKLVAYGENADALLKVLNKIISGMEKDGNTYTYHGSKNIKGSAYAPFSSLPRWKGGTLDDLWALGDGSFAVTVDNTTSESFDKYLTLLSEAGYKQYTVNTIAKNRFATYTTEKYEVNVAFYANLSRARIIAEPLGYLPVLTAPTYEKKVTATLTQFGAEDCYGDNGSLNTGTNSGGTSISWYDNDMRNSSGNAVAFGLSYVIQLEDGSFVIIDGGTYVTENSYYEGNEKDMIALLEFLETKNQGTGYSKPQVTWMITHAHSDHMSLACKFLETYYNRINVTMAAYSFPDYTDPNLVTGTESGKSYVNRFKTAIKTYYPEAAMFSFHAGQEILLPGCEIEILQTYEDYIHNDSGENGNPYNFRWLNYTSAVWKMHFNGVTYLSMGDLEFTTVDQLVNVYGAYLKSDIMQVTHHGYSGGRERFSMIFANNTNVPTICLWPTDGSRFFDDRRSGKVSATDFNKTLRQGAACYHFHAGHRVTVSLEDLSVSVDGEKLTKDDLGKTYNR